MTDHIRSLVVTPILAFGLALGASACSHGSSTSAAARTTPAGEDHEDDDPSAPPKSAAKLSQDQATAIALAKFPGDIVEAELEREHGHLIYSIEIRPTGQSKGVKEVNVDAIDGSIVNVEDEDEHEDGDGPGDENDSGKRGED